MSTIRVNRGCPSCGSFMRRVAPGGTAFCHACDALVSRGEGITPTHMDGVFMRAVALGCTPVWLGIYWECRCPGAVHGVATTYPVITTPSLERAQAEL